MLGKNHSPEIWAKMLSANQITGFLKEKTIQDKLTKESVFFAC